MFFKLSEHLLAQVVEHHDVGVHVEQVVGVGRVVVGGPRLGLWTFVREQVVAVFGLVIDAVKSCHLQDHEHVPAVTFRMLYDTTTCSQPAFTLI